MWMPPVETRAAVLIEDAEPRDARRDRGDFDEPDARHPREQRRRPAQHDAGADRDERLDEEHVGIAFVREQRQRGREVRAHDRGPAKPGTLRAASNARLRAASTKSGATARLTRNSEEGRSSCRDASRCRTREERERVAEPR
jgi:hypothetical protein